MSTINQVLRFDAGQPRNLPAPNPDQRVKLHPRQVATAVYEAANKYPELLPLAEAVERMIVHLDTVITEIGFSASLKDGAIQGSDGQWITGLEKIEHMAAKMPRWIFADDILKASEVNHDA